MLRIIFVFVIIAVGAVASIFGPFNALLFYLWNAYFRPEDWTYWGIIAALDLSWLIGLFLVLSTAMSMPKYPLNWRVGLMALFVFQSIVGVVTSEHFDVSWAGWVLFAKVALVSYFIIVLVNDQKRFRLTLLVIAVSLGAEAAKQGWAQLFLNPGAKNDNPIAFLGDNNGVALGTMMLVPLLGALAQTSASRIEAWGHRFLLVGVLMRGITTYSRGGFVAAVILGVVGFLRSPKKIRYVISAAILVTLVSTVMPQEFWDRISTITAPEEERDDSAAGRIHFWMVAVDMAKAKPFTGVGFNGFGASYSSYNTDERYPGDRAAHSTWFAVLADLGFPGFILLVSIWAMGVWNCWRVSARCKRDPTKRELRAYANGLLTSLMVFGTAGSFLSVQYGEIFWHFSALTVALVPLTSEAAAILTQPAVATQRVVARHPAIQGYPGRLGSVTPRT